MKYFIYLINCLLVVAIPTVFINTTINNSNTVTTSIEVKKVNSLKLATKTELKEELKQEDIVEENKKEEESKVAVKSVTKEETKEVVNTPKVEVPVIPPKEEKPVTDVLETLTGKMSGYGPDCRGCSGNTASGHNIKNSIYYNDSKYGNVRILAGDRSLRFGSIVRVKNSKIGTFTGIVLDRGGSIGIGKTFLFDLLFASEKEASIYGVSSKVTFEVLRYGY